MPDMTELRIPNLYLQRVSLCASEILAAFTYGRICGASRATAYDFQRRVCFCVWEVGSCVSKSGDDRD